LATKTGAQRGQIGEIAGQMQAYLKELDLDS
jgi:hypothetical protein